jgi:glycosyltransferase involved in cell wall biosynthesis
LCVLTETGVFYDTIPDSVKKVNLKISRVRYSGPRIFKLIKTTQPDVVFVFDVNNLILIVGLLSFLLPSRIKFITRQATVLSEFIKDYSFLKGFRRLLYRLVFRRFNLIICQSNYMREDLINHFNVASKKAIVINNPVEVEKIIQSASDDSPLLQANKTNIVAVGRIVYVKGYDLLIEALRLVKDPSVHLTIIGEKTPENPGYNDHILDLIEEYKLTNRVTLLGFQINPHKYVRQSDLLVISSRSEGFPNVALESIVVGTPVLAFNSPGGISEIVIEGINGWLVECGNVQKLAKAIDQIDKSKIDRVAIADGARKRFQVSAIIPVYEKVILDLPK